jgi:hypothetical protein
MRFVIRPLFDQRWFDYSNVKVQVLNSIEPPSLSNFVLKLAVYLKSSLMMSLFQQLLSKDVPELSE